jgi:RecG-like helicase
VSDNVEENEENVLVEEVVEPTKIEAKFSLPMLDQALWPLRRALSWGVSKGSAVRFVEANCSAGLSGVLESDAPEAVREAILQFLELLDGLDEASSEEQVARQAKIFGDVLLLDELVGLPLPLRRMRKLKKKSSPQAGYQSEPSAGAPNSQDAKAKKATPKPRRAAKNAEDELTITMDDLDSLLVEGSDEVVIEDKFSDDDGEKSDGRSDHRSEDDGSHARWTLEDAPTLVSLKVDEALCETLAQFGFTTIGHILLRRPVSYERFPNVQGAGRVEEPGRVAVSGRVAGWSTTYTPDGSESETLYLHGADTMPVTFEGSPTTWFRRFASDKKKMLLVADFDGTSLVNPEVIFSKNTKAVALAQYGIEGVEDRVIREVIRANIKRLDHLIDPLPAHLKKRVGLCDLSEALQGVHCEGDSSAMSRMVFDESLLVQLGQRVSSGDLSSLAEVRQVRGFTHAITHDKLSAFVRNIDIEPTYGELYALEQIKRDLASKVPMNRLLSGDVGLGRWLVALFSVVVVCQEKSQVLILTPDALTSRLRFLFTQPLLEEVGIAAIRIVGDPTPAELELLKNGKAQVVFASSSILDHPDVKFRRLALVVSEEQDERGVISERLDKRRGNRPDLLSFTVLPITTIGLLRDYPDTDISWVKGEPSPLECRLFGARARNEAYREVAERTMLGQQAIIMLPMVNGSDALGLADTIALASTLEADVFQGLKVAVFHGAMDQDVAFQAYTDFRACRFDVLLTTTMFEVGRSLPGVKTVLVEQADCTPDWRIRRILGHFRSQEARCLFVSGEKPDEGALDYIHALVENECVEGLLDDEVSAVSTEGLPSLDWIDLSSARDVIVSTRTEVSRIFDVEILSRPGDYGHLSETLRTRWPRYFSSECPLAEVKGSLTRRRRRRRRR